MKHSIRWVDRGRAPQCPPDPDYPLGKDIDLGERPACYVKLPYPAERCGMWVVHCNLCQTQIAITTAGRVDDPRSIQLPCKAVQ